jgi:hypothetical protein
MIAGTPAVFHDQQRHNLVDFLHYLNGLAGALSSFILDWD